MRLAAVLLPLALPILLGAQVEQVRAPVPTPPGGYTLHAVVPTAASVTGPIFVSTYPTASAVIGRTLTHNYHEVWAAIPAGAPAMMQVNTEGTAPAASMIDPIMITSLRNPDACVLEITGTDNVTERYPLTGLPPASSHLVVNNLLARTRYEHLNLGRFGYAHCWLTIRAGSKQIDVILDWHNCIVGSQDILFKSAKIACPQGVKWVPNLPDPASVDGTWQPNTQPAFLVRPTGMANTTHVLPRMWDRPFRFSVLLSNATLQQPWSNLGTAAWNWPIVPPANFAAPVSITGANIDGEIGAWRTSLRNNTGFQADGQGNGSPPVNLLYPAMGVTYGGMTGGIDMWPFVGVRWMVTGQTSGFERYAIEFLRGRARMFGSIVEANGGVVRPVDHLVGGQATWKMFNSQFEPIGSANPTYGPFAFPNNRLIPQAAYNPEPGPHPAGTPDGFDPDDCQHLDRQYNQMTALALLGADPIARYYLSMEAAKSLMTFWDGTGVGNHNINGNPPQGKGTGWGRAECYAAMVIAHNYVWASDTERAQYDHWIQVFVDHLTRAQMPSGLFQVNIGAKEAKNPPFSDTVNGNPNYVIGSGLEECYFSGALTCLGGIHPYAAARVNNLLRLQATGFRDLAWKVGSCGVWSHTARGPNDGSGLRYTTRADWPPTLTAGMIPQSPQCPTCPYIDCYHIGYMVACMKKAGSPMADELFMRYTGKPTIAQALAEVHNWGADHGTPCEQYWMVEGQYNQP